MINKFAIFMEVEKNYSKRTIEEYLSDLSLFNDFFKKDILEAKDSDIKEFLFYLKRDRNYSARGLLRKQATLKSFFRFCMREKKVVVNPMEFIESPKIPERKPEYLTDNERIRIFNEARRNINTLQGKRDYAIITLLYYTGIRIEELSALNMSDIHREGADIYLRIIGKGNKERHIPLKKEAEEILYMWLHARPSTEIKNEAVFINVHSKKRFLKRSAQEVVKQFGIKAGLTKKVSAHKFRHTFATKLLQEGANLVDIQTLLGHASLNTTRIYIHTNRQNLQNAINKL
ncbi:MAG: tyrosine-type recombinase/integrase [Bacteroidetes bacterium]|nr:tyrosine-type recombinase/integrase [Bacteroidota bacterium]